jgi:hypothetical protein
MNVDVSQSVSSKQERRDYLASEFRFAHAQVYGHAFVDSRSGSEGIHIYRMCNP